MQAIIAHEMDEDRHVLADVSVHEDTRQSIRLQYPASAFRGPLFETRDRIALAMATVMLLGPLAVLPLGLG